MLPNIRKTATAAIAALSLGATLPAPAQAWGEREQNALAAIVAAGLIGTFIVQQNRRQHAATVTRAPVRTTPGYYQQPYQQPRYQAPSPYQPAAPSGIYSSAAARAFNSYSPSQRRAIQSRLANAGYYNGAIDGSFGPMTHRAVVAIAGDSTGTGQLDTMGGAFEFYDAILG